VLSAGLDAALLWSSQTPLTALPTPPEAEQTRRVSAPPSLMLCEVSRLRVRK
jgi:hypothetical protein